MAAIDFRPAWRKNDPELERHAVAFWTRKRGLLPANVDPAQRAKELCAVAYREGRPVGVATATIDYVPTLRSRMAVYRCAVSINLRHEPLSWQITDYSRQVLEKWSLENPAEKLMGLMAIIQSRELVSRYPQVWAPAGMNFVGFAKSGHPIRIAWFKHATIPAEWPPRPEPAGW